MDGAERASGGRSGRTGHDPPVGRGAGHARVAGGRADLGAIPADGDRHTKCETESREASVAVKATHASKLGPDLSKPHLTVGGLSSA